MNVKRTECDMCHGTLNPEDNADVGVYIDFEGDGGYSIIGDAEDYRVHFLCAVLPRIAWCAQRLRGGGERP